MRHDADEAFDATEIAETPQPEPVRKLGDFHRVFLQALVAENRGNAADGRSDGASGRRLVDKLPRSGVRDNLPGILSGVRQIEELAEIVVEHALIILARLAQKCVGRRARAEKAGSRPAADDAARDIAERVIIARVRFLLVPSRIRRADVASPHEQ